MQLYGHKNLRLSVSQGYVKLEMLFSYFYLYVQYIDA